MSGHDELADPSKRWPDFGNPNRPEVKPIGAITPHPSRERPLCRNCGHQEFSSNAMACNEPRAPVDPVEGHGAPCAVMRMEQALARTQREDIKTTCGPKGEWFIDRYAP